MADPGPSGITYDTLQNLVTGMGTSNDPLKYTEHVFEKRLSPEEIEALYLNDWLGAPVINAIPNDTSQFSGRGRLDSF